jgi:hypothetical protein
MVAAAIFLPFPVAFEKPSLSGPYPEGGKRVFFYFHSSPSMSGHQQIGKFPFVTIFSPFCDSLSSTRAWGFIGPLYLATFSCYFRAHYRQQTG